MRRPDITGFPVLGWWLLLLARFGRRLIGDMKVRGIDCTTDIGLRISDFTVVSTMDSGTPDGDFMAATGTAIPLLITAP